MQGLTSTLSYPLLRGSQVSAFKDLQDTTNRSPPPACSPHRISSGPPEDRNKPQDCRGTEDHEVEQKLDENPLCGSVVTPRRRFSNASRIERHFAKPSVFDIAGVPERGFQNWTGLVLQSCFRLPATAVPARLPPPSLHAYPTDLAHTRQSRPVDQANQGESGCHLPSSERVLLLT